MKRIYNNLKNMCPQSKWLLKGGLMITSALLLGSIVLMRWAGNWSLDTYYILRCADTMMEVAPAVLFVTIIGSAWWEERHRKTQNT